MGKNKKPSVINRAFHIAAQGKGSLIIGFVCSTIGMLASIMPYLSVYFIARELLMPQAEESTSQVFAFWIILAGVSIIIRMIFTFLGSYLCHRVAFRLLYNFRIKVMEHIGRLPIGFFADNTTGGIQKNMDENIEKIEGFVAHMLPDIIGSAFVTISLFVSLFMLNVWIALAVLVTIIGGLAIQLSIFGGKKARQLWVDVSTANKNMTGAFSEYIKGMAEMKLFGMAGSITHGLEENIDNYQTWELQQYKRSAVPMSIYKTLILSLLTVVLPIGILLIIHNPVPATYLVVLMALVISPAIYDPLLTCINYGAQLGMLAVGLDSVESILETKAIEAPHNPKTPSVWDVAFNNVSFSYQEVDDPLRVYALKDISFSAPQGQMTALVGPSGGGKSTVIQLLSRFWDVEAGCITIGGVDIRDIDPPLLMDNIATVLQDTYIFADSIWGNITMNRAYTKEQVDDAAKKAQCYDFISQFPDGYNTRIGTGGASLSGGEAQRISIARAILKDSPIVVLDEALAYSDAENENLIQAAIHNLVKNKTIIVIAHRLQSIQKAEQILLLDHGEITERGTHSTLMEQQSKYQLLWELQHEADAWAIEVTKSRR